MKIQVRLNNYRRSPRKVREIIPVIKGLEVEEALTQLYFVKKAGAIDLRKLLLSAIATAENDFNIKKSDLIVGEVMVQEGKTLKRWRARAYGRANQILKRTCHILLTVEEKNSKLDKSDEVKGNKGEKGGKEVSKGKDDVIKKDTVTKKKVDKEEGRITEQDKGGKEKKVTSKRKKVKKSTIKKDKQDK